MIGSSSPVCSGAGLTVTSCTFSVSTRILKLDFSLRSGADSALTTTFEIRPFKNPVKPETITGFVIQTLDSEDYAIGLSSSAYLSGVTLPNLFANVVFSYEDNPIVGEYSSFSIEIAMAHSLGSECYIRIKFPEEFTTDSQLVAAYGTSFMRPRSGSRISFFQSDLSNRIFSFAAC